MYIQKLASKDAIPTATSHKAFRSTIAENQESTMIHHKRFAQLARKWQQIKAAIRDDNACCTKGHCTVDTADGKRFEVPLAYLGTMVFSELLWMFKEESGFTHDVRITLPCDAAVVKYVMCLLRRNTSEEVEKAFLSSVAMPCQP